jgi:hypothetical protein
LIESEPAMTHSMTLTLAAWQDFIWIAVFAAVMLGSWISNLKKQSQEQRKRDEGPNALELDEMAARRREQLRQASRSRAQATGGEGGPAGGHSGARSGGASGEPGNMTMAERIARARAKAQYEQRAQGAGQSAQRSQAQVPNEAQRRALAQRRAELERQQQAARAQQQAQQRTRQQAQQRAQQQTRRQQRAQAHARAQAQARQRGALIHEDVAVPEPTQSTTRRIVKDRPAQSQVTRPQQTMQAVGAGPVISGSLSRNDLRRAIVLNEVLGKPIAMRESEGL